jgi:hypothetical protein
MRQNLPLAAYLDAKMYTSSFADNFEIPAPTLSMNASKSLSKNKITTPNSPRDEQSSPAKLAS